MATDSDRSAETWSPDAVAERALTYFQRVVGLRPNQWLTEIVGLGRIVEVDEHGRMVGTRVVRVYPGGPVPGDIERMMLTEAYEDALAERRSRN